MREAAGSNRWLAFTGGLLLGTVAGVVGLAVAALMARSTRSQSMRVSEHLAAIHPEDRDLDEELAQTFPASDPLPYSHRVD